MKEQKRKKEINKGKIIKKTKNLLSFLVYEESKSDPMAIEIEMQIMKQEFAKLMEQKLEIEQCIKNVDSEIDEELAYKLKMITTAPNNFELYMQIKMAIVENLTIREKKHD